MIQSMLSTNTDVLVLYLKTVTVRQGKFIYIAHFIHSGNSKCFT